MAFFMVVSVVQMGTTADAEWPESWVFTLMLARWFPDVKLKMVRVGLDTRDATFVHVTQGIRHSNT